MKVDIVRFFVLLHLLWLLHRCCALHCERQHDARACPEAFPGDSSAIWRGLAEGWRGRLLPAGSRANTRCVASALQDGQQTGDAGFWKCYGNHRKKGDAPRSTKTEGPAHKMLSYSWIPGTEPLTPGTAAITLPVSLVNIHSVGFTSFCSSPSSESTTISPIHFKRAAVSKLVQQVLLAAHLSHLSEKKEAGIKEH